MTPLQTAARFAAFVWYTSNREAPDQVLQLEAQQFANDNWKTFLPIANEGLGRLLLRVAKSPAIRLLRARSANRVAPGKKLAAVG